MNQCVVKNNETFDDSLVGIINERSVSNTGLYPIEPTTHVLMPRGCECCASKLLCIESIRTDLMMKYSM